MTRNATDSAGAPAPEQIPHVWIALAWAVVNDPRDRAVAEALADCVLEASGETKHARELLAGPCR